MTMQHPGDPFELPRAVILQTGIGYDIPGIYEIRDNVDYSGPQFGIINGRYTNRWNDSRTNFGVRGTGTSTPDAVSDGFSRQVVHGPARRPTAQRPFTDYEFGLFISELNGRRGISRGGRHTIRGHTINNVLYANIAFQALAGLQSVADPTGLAVSGREFKAIIAEGTPTAYKTVVLRSDATAITRVSSGANENSPSVVGAGTAIVDTGINLVATTATITGARRTVLYINAATNQGYIIYDGAGEAVAQVGAPLPTSAARATPVNNPRVAAAGTAFLNTRRTSLESFNFWVMLSSDSDIALVDQWRLTPGTLASGGGHYNYTLHYYGRVLLVGMGAIASPNIRGLITRLRENEDFEPVPATSRTIPPLAAVPPPAPPTPINWFALGDITLPGTWRYIGDVTLAQAWTEVGSVPLPSAPNWLDLGEVAFTAAPAAPSTPYPITIPGDIGGGDPLPAPPVDLPAPTGNAGYSVWLQNGVDVAGQATFANITGLVTAASWRHGGLGANRLGGVEEPAVGLLWLNNERGHWNAYNPTPSVETAPGAEVEIRAGNDRDGALLFKGWTRGVQNAETPNAPAQAQMPIYSILTRIVEFGEGIFANATGFRPLSEHMDLLLNTMGVQAQGIGRDLESGLDALSVSGSNLNSSGLVSSGLRKRAAPLGVFNALAQLEGGRIYDNRAGQFVMTAFRGYGDGRARQTRDIGEVSPASFQSLDPSTTVVNLIELDERDPYQSVGTQQLTQDADGTQITEVGFPVTIEPNTSGVVAFNLLENPNWAVALSWVSPVAGQHYRLSDGVEYAPEGFYADSETMQWVFRNTTDSAAQVRILKAEVIPGVVSLSQRRWIRPARNDASIRRYGRHAVQFPIALAERTTGPTLGELRRRMETWAEQYAGVTDRGVAKPWLAARVLLPDWDFADGVFDIDDAVTLSVERGGAAFFRNKGFFVRGVEYHCDANRVDCTLTILEPRGVPVA